MPRLQHVPLQSMDAHRFQPVLSAEEYGSLLDLIEHAPRLLRGRVIWNVNSTAKGGGVVELLQPLLGYTRGMGIDARWVVISGEPPFFDLTKRIHNHLHGFPGDGGPLGEEQRRIYEHTLAGNARELAELISPYDVVILHDPQTAGLLDAVRQTGATVVWRCHVGHDRANERSRLAWNFLRPYVQDADAYVFSRRAFAWEGLDESRIAVIHPSIDAFAPKNAEQTPAQTRAILARAGIVPTQIDDRDATFRRTDGTPGRVDRRAQILESAPLTPEDRLVLQVSRWDRLKDPLGVINGFAEHTAPEVDGHLMLAGPSTESVADDPEGAEVFEEVRAAWHKLPESVRSRIHLVSLPMDDVEENAAIVNALQRHAEVVVQKSLAEGFGLTVAEAMWKARPVVASRIGGIQDQIVHGQSGTLLNDPCDPVEFGGALVDLLKDGERAREVGAAARERVRDEFLGPHHLRVYFELFQRLGAVGNGNSAGPPAEPAAPVDAGAA